MANFRLLSFFLLMGLAIPSESFAKKKEKKAPSAKASKAKTPKLIGGALPPLPASSGASFNFEGESAEASVYATAVSGAADFAKGASAATPQVSSWTIANWRLQMGEDIKKLQARKIKIRKKLELYQRQDFAVAVRYLRGVYDSTAQLHRLSEQVLVEFNDAFPADRNAEVSLKPPEAARRVRLYLDKVMGLDQSSDAFLVRTTQERKETIVRIEDE